MNKKNPTLHPINRRVSDALDEAIKLVGDKGLATDGHFGEALVLCGLLTLALLLENQYVSETR